MLQAGGDIAGSVSVTRNLYAALANHDVTANITAGEIKVPVNEPGGVRASRDINADITATTSIAWVSAGRSIVGSSHKIEAGSTGNLPHVSAGMNIEADIKAGGNISLVSAGATLSGDVISSAGAITTVEAGPAWANPGTMEGRILGSTIRAKGNIGTVKAVAATGHTGLIGSAAAAGGGAPTRTTIESQEGQVDAVTSTGSIDATIKAKGRILGVSAGSGDEATYNGGSIAGSIESTDGEVFGVTAHGAVEFSSGGMTFTGGSIGASVKAGTNVGTVQADVDIIGSIEAWLDVGTVSAGRDITGAVTSWDKNIGSVTAGRDMTGELWAWIDIGNIEAGRNLGVPGATATTHIMAVNGSIGDITAGAGGAGGNLTADIWAAGRIGDIDVLGTVNPFWINPWNPMDAPTAGPHPTWSEQDLYHSATGASTAVGQLRRLDDLPEGMSNAQGELVGPIHAGTSIGAITAYGKIDATIDADAVGEVWTLGDITGGIQAHKGGLTVYSWGKIDAALIGGASVNVAAYDDLSGKVVSGEAEAHASSWHDTTNSFYLFGKTGAFVWAHHALGGDIQSGNTVKETTWGTLSSKTSAFGEIVAAALTIDGAVWESLEPVVAVAAGDIRNTQLASLYVFAQAAGDIDGLSVTAIDADITAEGKLDMDSLVTYGGAMGPIQFIAWYFWHNPLNFLQLFSPISVPNPAKGISLISAQMMWDTDGVFITPTQFGSDLMAGAQKVDAAWNQIKNMPPEEALARAGELTGQLLEEIGSILANVLKSLPELAETLIGALADLPAVWARLNNMLKEFADQYFGWANLLALDNVHIGGGNVDGTLSIGSNGVSGDIKAAHLDVTSWSGYSATTNVVHDAKLMVHGAVTAPITSAEGTVDITASGDITGEIAGAWGMDAESWGAVSGKISSDKAGVSIDAMGNVTGEVDGHGAVSITTFGSLLSSSVKSLGHIDILAAAGISGGEIKSGGDVRVESWADIDDAITAGDGAPQTVADGGYFADVTAHGSVLKAVTASHDVSIAAHQDVTGAVTSRFGGAVVEAAGSISGGVTAQKDVTAWAMVDVGGAISSAAGAVDIHAHQDARAAVDAWTTASVRADRRAEVTVTIHGPNGSVDIAGLEEAAQAVKATVTAPAGSVSVFSGGGAEVSVAAGTGAGGGAGGPAAAKNVSVTALGDLKGTVTATDSVELFAWGKIEDMQATTSAATSSLSVTAAAKLKGSFSSGGTLDAASLDNVSGDYKAGQAAGASATADASVAAKLGASGITVASGTGSASLDVGLAIDGSVTAAKEASAAAGTSLSGTVQAGTTAAAYALDGALSGSVQAGGTAYAIAGTSLFGSVEAGYNKTDPTAHAYAKAMDALFGTVSADGNASVSAYAGLIGSITAGKGATVFAGSLLAAVTAGESAELTSSGLVLASVQAGQNADVYALGSVMGGITGGQNATVFSAAGVLAPVTATAGDALVQSGGDIAGAVNAGHDAATWSLGSLSAPVSGGHDASVTAWGSVTATVTATAGAAEVATEGNLAAPVSAGTNAQVFAAGDVAATVNAGQDASVVSGGSVAAAITAERDADVTAGGDVAAPVTAGRDGAVFSLADVVGNVTAARDADVSAWGKLADAITAGGNATAWSAGNMTVTIGAGGGATAQSFGSTFAAVTAGASANVWSFGQLTATVSAGGGADVSSLNDAYVQVTAGGDANVSAGTWLTGSVQAGGSAGVQSLGNVTAGITAGFDAWAFALDNLGGTWLTAGHDATAASFGFAVGIVATGGHAVWAFSNGPLDAALNSGGWVEAFAGGDAFILGSAGWDADLTALGNLAGGYYAGGTARAFAGGDLLYSLTSGASAYASTYGNAAVFLSAAQDAWASSVGDGLDFVSAGYNVRLTAYGDLIADVTATGDIDRAWSRGDLSGTFTADEVFEVKSYGTIDVGIDARRIDLVEAWGDILGALDALEQIGVIRSVADVLATLTAPNTISVQEHDHTLLLGEYPADPPTSLAGVRAYLNHIYRELVQAREALDQDKLGIPEMLRAASASVTAGFQPSLGDPRAAQAAVTDSVYGLLSSLALAQDADVQALLDAQFDVQAAVRRITAIAAMEKALDLRALHDMKVEADYFVSDMLNDVHDREEVAQAMQDAKVTEQQAQLTSFDRASDLWPDQFRERARNLVRERLNAALDVLQAVLSVVGMLDGHPALAVVGGIADLTNSLISLARGNYGDAALNAVSAIPLAGMALKGGKTGSRVAAKLLGHADDLGDVLKYADDAAHLGKFAGKTADLVKGYKNGEKMCWIGKAARALKLPEKIIKHLPGCFVADTLVMALPENYSMASTAAPTEREEIPWDKQFLVVGGVAIAFGMAAWWIDERRRKNGIPDSAALDEIFENGDDDDMPWETDDCRHTAADFDPAGEIADDLTAALCEGSAFPGQTAEVMIARCKVRSTVVPAGDMKFGQLAPPSCRMSSLSAVDGREQAPTPWCSEHSRHFIVATPRPCAQTFRGANERTRRRSGLRWGRCVLAVGLLLGALCGLRAIPSVAPRVADRPPSAATGPSGAKTSSSPFVPIPIQDIRVGRKVQAENPTGEKDLEFGEEVDPATWKWLILRCPKADGSWAEVELLRPDWWVDIQNARRGGKVYIAVPECGIDGEADVLDIRPCPSIQNGPGRVVTGTFKHLGAKVVDLYIEGLDEPIGATPNHLFWSNTRHSFVPMIALRPDELISDLAGSPRVLRVIERQTPTTVYNLEVQIDHVYLVSKNGVLTHNPLTCIPWSSHIVQRAAGLLKRGAREVRVKNRSQAEELFLRLFQGDGYRNVSGWAQTEVKRRFKNGGFYHWDDVFDETSKLLPGQRVLRGHYDDGKLHNYVRHLQIHLFGNEKIRILFD